MKDLNNEKKVRFIVLDNHGNETELPKDDYSELIENQCDPILAKLVRATVGSEKSIHFANHMEIMQQLELVDYEPASDRGHFRFYPNGALMYQLLTNWCEQIATENFGALPLKTPFIYSLNSKAVQEQIGIFTKDIYSVFGGQNDEEFVLRFNDDLGLFEVMKNSQITYRHLPVRIFEHTPSFRYNKSGSLSGIRRGRYFSFTDIHSFCQDLQHGLTEYEEIHRVLTNVAKQVGIKPVIHFKATQTFYPTVKNLMISMLNNQEKMLVEIIPSQRQYWAMKHIICTDHPQTLFHIQLDLENSKRFDITYMDKDGVKKNCVIVHGSLGSIEKWMVIAIEDALKKEVPVLPLWLTPTQVRIIPVANDKHTEFCIGVAEELKRHQIRVDVDERSGSVNQRIRTAEREWIPYIVVCGDQEQSGSPLSVRIRGKAQQKFNIPELTEMINKLTAGMPFKSLPGILLSKRPVFRGGN